MEQEIQVIVKPKEDPARRLEHDTFAGREKAIPVSISAYYIATSNEDVVGIVGISESDRPVVAAIVGNWIADGFDVTKVSTRELLKKMRAIHQKELSFVALASASKTEENASGAQENASGVAGEEGKPEPAETD